MARNPRSGDVPEQPRSEPEIIPPGRGDRRRGDDWTDYQQYEAFQRIYMVRPGWPSVILGLLILGFLAALAFVVVAGIIILWVPILIAGILLAVASAFFRRRRRW